MKCPACLNELTALQSAPLKVDVCQDGCGGIWFDAFELQRVDDETESAGEPLLQIRRDAGLFVDASRKRECPRCQNMKLKRHLFSPKSRVEVDECPNCGGYWLDDGELARIRAERARIATLEQASQAAVSPELIRYMYQVRTGQNKGRPL